jgi:hypothetical protein
MSMNFSILASGALALVAYAAWRQTEATFLIFVASSLFGFALTQIYGGDFLASANRGAIFSHYTLCLFVLASIVGFSILGAVDFGARQFIAVTKGRDIASLETARSGLTALAFMASSLPLIWHGFTRDWTQPGTLPLWPIAAGIVGAAGIWCAGTILWFTLIEPMIVSKRSMLNIWLHASLAVSTASLLMGVFALVFARGFSSELSDEFVYSDIWGRGISITLSGVSLSAIFLGVIIFSRFMNGLNLVDDTVFWCAIGTVGILFCWRFALLDLQTFQHHNLVFAGVIMVFLLVTMALSFGLPLSFANPNGRMALNIILTVPAIIFSGFLILKVVPPIVRFLGRLGPAL